MPDGGEMKHNMKMSGGGEMKHDMSPADHEKMMRDMHQQTLWAHFVNLLLGVWLIASPFALGYRSAGLTWSDVASGALIVVFSMFSFPRRTGTYARWANCFVGIWLLFAPLVFWAPTSAGYMNDTLTGALVIAFAVLIPGMPGMNMMAMMSGPDVPPGWSYGSGANGEVCR